MATSSTGRSRPNGRVHCAWMGSRDGATAQGRDDRAPRLRERQATTTSAWPVAMAMAACPMVAQPAPPP